MKTNKPDDAFTSGARILRPLVVVVLFIMSASVALAVPMKFTGDDGKDLPGAARWPKGTTIKVYIPADPIPGGTRNKRIEEGVQRWKDELQKRGITLEINEGAPPAGATNAVVFTFVEPGSLPADSHGKPQDGITSLSAGQNADGSVGAANGAEVRISNEIGGTDYIQNLAAHEFGHALGFADEPTQGGKPRNVMDHTVPRNGATTFTDADKAELNTLYADAGGRLPSGSMFASVVPVIGGFEYSYTATWISGPDIPFIQIGTGERGVFDITAGGFSVVGTNGLSTAPNGFFLADPRDGRVAGYMEDVIFAPLPTGQLPGFLTFINTQNPLGPLHPSYTFTFTSAAEPGMVQAYLSGENVIWVTGPASVPDMTDTWLLFGGVLLGLLGLSEFARRASCGVAVCEQPGRCDETQRAQQRC